VFQMARNEIMQRPTVPTEALSNIPWARRTSHPERDIDRVVPPQSGEFAHRQHVTIQRRTHSVQSTQDFGPVSGFIRAAAG